MTEDLLQELAEETNVKRVVLQYDNGTIEFRAKDDYSGAKQELTFKKNG